MELYERQQFDVLLQAAVERYVERLQQRNEGSVQALARLRADSMGEGIWLDQFVDAFFDDFLLNNEAGASFILRALGSRKATGLSSGPNQTVEQFMISCAKTVFMDLLYQKTEECLERYASFQASPASAD
jgi:hypothetical protein